MTAGRLSLLIILILLLIGILVGYQIMGKYAPQGQTERLDNDFIVVQGNSIMAVSSVYYPHIYTYGVLLDCLEFYESSHCDTAVGEAGEIGCLQWLPSSFEYHCEGDIWDCDTQRDCANRLLEEDFGNIRHWKATAKFCL
jgi:hypothetical protein